MFEATGHSFPPRNVIFGLRELSTIRIENLVFYLVFRRCAMAATRMFTSAT